MVIFDKKTVMTIATVVTHKDLTEDNIHEMVSKTFSNTIERLTHVYSIFDKHKLIYQIDTEEYFIIKTVSNLGIANFQLFNPIFKTFNGQSIIGSGNISILEPVSQFIAGENIGSNLAVRLHNGQIFLASQNISTHANKVIGITSTSAQQNNPISVQTTGQLNGLFGLIADEPIFLSINGILTQNIPTTGFIQQVGIAITSTTMFISIQPSLAVI